MAKPRRGVLVALLAVVAVIAAVSASASSGTTGQKPSGTIQLAGWASSPAETALLKQVLRGFQKTFPAIKVDYAPISGDYGAAMLAKFAARTPPDVFYVDSNVIPDWINQGVIQPLDTYVAAQGFSLKPFYPNLLNAFKGPDGKLYGLPKDWSPLAVQTLDKYFAQAGVTPPTTQAQVRTVAQKLATVMPSGTAPVCMAADWARVLAFVYQNGGTFVDVKAKKMTVDSAATRATVQWLVGMRQAGLAKTPAELGVGWCGEALGKEKAAIVFEGNWLIPAMQADYPSVKYTVSRMVSGTKGHGNLAFTVSYSMARDSKNKAAAWQLIRYLESKPGMKTWTSKGLALPSRSDVAPVAGRTPFILDAPFVHPWQFAPGFAKVMDVAGNELSGVFEGKQTIDGMLAKITSEGNTALARK